MGHFDETVDFVVVGSGGGSMCAGLYLQERGWQVLILEKTGLVGGTTARAGGVMWIPDNGFLRRDGIEDNFEKAATYLDGLAADNDDCPGSTQERRHRYIREAPRMLDFLLDQGIKLVRASYWPDYYDERSGGLEVGRSVIPRLFNARELGSWRGKLRSGFLDVPATIEEALYLSRMKTSWRGKRTLLKVAGRILLARLTGKDWISAGASLQGQMLKASLKAGVAIRTESPVGELLEEEGRVVGVVTEKNGRPWTVGAKLGVLVNAGGFARNQAMRDQYQPGTSAAWSSVAPGDTGEMIREMMRHGAAVAQMEEMVGNQNTLPPGIGELDIKPSAQQMTAAPHAMLVDRSGVRFMNEGGSYMLFCQNMLKRNRDVPAIPCWAVFDSQYIRKYMLAGTMPGTRKPKSWYQQGYLKRGKSLEALAVELNIDPKALCQTVDRFNGFVHRGRDEDFGRGDRAYDRWLGDANNKPAPNLGTIEKAPFYAVPVYPGDVGTYGGVVTDVHARVLREDGGVIPGLYATGVSTASVMGRVYPGAGSSIGPSFVWGYVAAKHAASVGS